MPSPFPGMNPYLESPACWSGFHMRYIVKLASMLTTQLAPPYFADVEDGLYLHADGDEARRLVAVADVSVRDEDAAKRGRIVGDGATSAVVEEAPASVMLDLPEPRQRQARIEIRTSDQDRLITAIELLSPANKRIGPDREQYLRKRSLMLRSTAHLVEIDLLRKGQPMPMQPVPSSPYSVTVSVYAERPHAGFWPIGLRDPLPKIPIPLLDEDAPAHLDLQQALHEVYDEAGYHRRIYRQLVDGPLSDDDRRWLHQHVPAETRGES